jgi:LysM repeat protein
MRHWKRLFYYLMINVIVSACTVLLVLSIWERGRAPTIDEWDGLNFSVFDPAQTETIAHRPKSTETLVVEREIAVESATELPEALDTPVITEYQVRTGDSLGAIASRFGLSVEALMEANNITDPNRVDVGQILIIPQLEEPTATRTSIPAEPTATFTPQPTATEVDPNGEPLIFIDSVIGAGDLATERVMLKRAGSGELSLEGWQLVDEEGLVFTFPQFKLYEAGGVYVYSKAGQPTSVQLFWGLDEPVWQSGELVTLLDEKGQVQTTYRVP